MEIHKACSFFGTNALPITNELKSRLREVIADLVDNGFDIFYFGGLSEFDDICYQIVSEFKMKFANICRIFCLPNPRWQRIVKRPAWLKERQFEEVVWLDLKFDYWYTRIYYRNCEMINRSDKIIFFAPKDEKSGAYKALKYAKRIKKDFVNLISSHESSENIKSTKSA